MADTTTSPALKSYNDIPVLDWEAFEGAGVTSYDVFRDLRARRRRWCACPWAWAR